jgi:hypothetical protein
MRATYGWSASGASAHGGERRRDPVTGQVGVPLSGHVAAGPRRLGQVRDGPCAQGEELAAEQLGVGARELG